jgi:hypothetical protein
MWIKQKPHCLSTWGVGDRTKTVSVSRSAYTSCPRFRWEWCKKCKNCCEWVRGTSPLGRILVVHVSFIKYSDLTRITSAGFPCVHFSVHVTCSLFTAQGVRMKGIENKKKMYISELIVIHVSGLCHRKGKFWKFFFHASLMCMRQLATFGELSNDVDITGTILMLA